MTLTAAAVTGPQNRRPASIPFGIGAGTGIVLLIAASLAFEPRLSELGALGYVGRFALVRAAAGLGFGLAGSLVVAFRPLNRFGWLMLAIGAVQAGSLLAESYGLVGVMDPTAEMPLAGWLLWVSSWVWAPAYLLIPTVFLLLFPDARLPSTRWRPAAVVALMAVAASAAGWAALPASENDVAQLFPAGFTFPVRSFPAFASAALGLTVPLTLLGAVAGVASLVVRYRRGAGTAECEQVKWVLLAAVVVVPLVGAGVSGLSYSPLLMGVAMVPLPLAIALAVTQHRLWDIDLVLSRSLVLGTLTLAVLAVYAVCVLALGQVLGARTGAPLVSTALVAVGIQPLHSRVRRRVNRFVYGDRGDPADALRRVGEQLKGAATPRGALEEMSQSVAAALRVPYVAIEASRRIAASWGQPTSDQERVALGHRGDDVGTLVVGVGPGDRLRRRDRDLLEELAPHVAVIVHAHRLADGLARSHDRLLAAREEERQRVRRDLHDGLGATLAALALEVDRRRLLVGRRPEMAPELLDDLSGRIRDAVKAVRAIVDDLRPPPLEGPRSRGLAPGARPAFRRRRHHRRQRPRRPPAATARGRARRLPHHRGGAGQHRPSCPSIPLLDRARDQRMPGAPDRGRWLRDASASVRGRRPSLDASTCSRVGGAGRTCRPDRGRDVCECDDSARSRPERERLPMTGDADRAPTRVVVVEDHPMFREGLVALLNELDDVQVVGQAATGHDAVEIVDTMDPDVVLMDLQLPGMSGVEATQRIVRQHPETPVLALTMMEDEATILAAVRAGARGYLLKEASPEEIVRSLDAVRHGQVVFGGVAAAHVLASLARADARRPVPELTEREHQVLELLAQGLTNAAIGERLYLSVKTVRNHVSNVFTKLHVTDRAAAVARARDAGLGRPPR